MVVIKVKRDTCGGEKYLKNAVNKEKRPAKQLIAQKYPVFHSK